MRYLMLPCSILIFTVAVSQEANIFAIFTYPGKSHVAMGERLLKRLAEKGHNVDIATHFPSEEVPARYKQMSLEGVVHSLTNNMSIHYTKDYSVYRFIRFVCTNEAEQCRTILNSPILQNIKRTQKKYDLVVTQILSCDCMLGFGNFFNATIVSLVTFVSLPWASDRVGNPDNPSYIPNYFAQVNSNMNLYQRIENVISLLESKFFNNFFGSEQCNRAAQEFFGANLPTLESLAQETNLILINNHFSMNVWPTVKNVIEIGGLHVHEPRPLSKYFESLVTTDARGIIFLSMGSMMMTETFSPDKLQGMFDAFAELPYKVLWKAVPEKFPKGLVIPENIHFEKWMPQMDILCHPSVKLFISHGGLLGGQEAVYCGVPRIGIPLFADQNKNILLAEEMGIAVKVSYNDISKETILSAVGRILKDTTYTQNTERISRLFRDRPLSPLDTAVYWLEHVIKHKGAPYLQNPAAVSPWYQYYLIDVGLILVFVFFAALCVTVLLLRTVARLICGT